MSTLSLIAGIWIVYGSFAWGYEVIGWSSLISTVFFSTGIILVIIGISGVYLGEIFKEVKGRPLYIIDRKL
jgi:dolichol-phosphate mannosyltransferase